MTQARCLPPRIHGHWTEAWWGGDPALAALFGPAPSLTALDAVAHSLDARRDGSAAAPVLDLEGREQALPDDALVVLAGQQPVLAGGPLLVPHKTATAIALARTLERHWQRPVVPVFLLATEDHDSSEIDHIDSIDTSSGALVRHRAHIEPKHEAFFRCRWDRAGLRAAIGHLCPGNQELAAQLVDDDSEQSLVISDHVVRLLRLAFGGAGLHAVEAHRLGPWGRDVLERALADPAGHAAALAAGGEQLEQRGLAVSFDTRDPRPLVLESRAGRRKRVGARDDGVRARLAADPGDFSPQAALRPIVQAKALPVVAQVCGPSELLYLGQARGLHALHDAVPPVLVPRLEATRVDAAAAEQALELLSDDGSGSMDAELVQQLETLRQAAREFAQRVETLEPSLSGKLERWLGSTEQGARRLAEAPGWRGQQAAGVAAFVRPRDRYQDAVLAWLPEVARAADPAAWGRHIIGLCRPLEPPRHVLHSFPPEALPPGAIDADSHTATSSTATDAPQEDPRDG